MRRFLDLLLEPAAAPSIGAGPRVSRRTLELIRWAAVIGQAATLLLVHLVLRFPLPLGPALCRPRSISSASPAASRHGASVTAAPRSISATTSCSSRSCSS